MAVSIIDGTIEAAVLKRVRGKVRIYESITFKLADGSGKSIAKAVVEERVAALLEPGASGRFYLYDAFDHRGIHGVRDDRGRAVFGFANTNEAAMRWVVIVALIMIAAYVAILDSLSGWGILLLVLGVPAYFLYRATRVGAERQFQADNPGIAAA